MRSHISERKWAAKGREDARGAKGATFGAGSFTHTPAPDNGPSKTEMDRLVQKQAFAHEQATNKTRQAEAAGRKAEAQGREARALAARQYTYEQIHTSSGIKTGKNLGGGGRTAAVDTAHLAAAQLHNMAAQAHDIAAQAHAGVGNMAKANEHAAKAEEHRGEAREHTLTGGGDWDESKHPRDEAGRFS